MAERPPVEADAKIDITGVVCPVTFVKVKMALDDLEIGRILAIRLNDGEPVQNVPRSLKEEGQKVLRLNDNRDGTYELIVRKESD